MALEHNSKGIAVVFPAFFGWVPLLGDSGCVKTLSRLFCLPFRHCLFDTLGLCVCVLFSIVLRTKWNFILVSQKKKYRKISNAQCHHSFYALASIILWKIHDYIRLFMAQNGTKSEKNPPQKNRIIWKQKEKRKPMYRIRRRSKRHPPTQQ